MLFMPYLLVNADNGWTKDRAHQFTLSSCLLFNNSQLHYYCKDSDQDKINNVPVAEDDLNTIEITEQLCGNFNDPQGSYNM